MNWFAAENGTVQIKGETAYKVTDVIDIPPLKVRMETRNIDRVISFLAIPHGWAFIPRSAFVISRQFLTDFRFENWRFQNWITNNIKKQCLAAVNFM